MQDSPAYNHLGYLQESYLTNPKPNPNSLTLTETLARSLIRTKETHHSCKSPICFQKYIIIPVGRLLIFIVLWIAKLTDRAGRSCI